MSFAERSSRVSGIACLSTGRGPPSILRFAYVRNDYSEPRGSRRAWWLDSDTAFENASDNAIAECQLDRFHACADFCQCLPAHLR